MWGTGGKRRESSKLGCVMQRSSGDARLRRLYAVRNEGFRGKQQ